MLYHIRKFISEILLGNYKKHEIVLVINYLSTAIEQITC